MTSHLNIMFNVYVISFYLESPDLGKSALVTCKYSQLVNYAYHRPIQAGYVVTLNCPIMSRTQITILYMGGNGIYI